MWARRARVGVPPRRARTAAATTVVSGFVILAVSNAAGFYGLAVYLGNLKGDGRFSLGLVSSLTSVFFLVSGVTGLVVARSLGTLGVRTMVMLGAAAGAGGMWLVGHAQHPWQLMVGYTLLGCSMAMTGPIVLTTALIDVVTVPAKRNQAMAVMLSGMTAGGALFVPLLAWAVESHGLARTTSVGAAVVVLAVAGPALMLHVDRSQSSGQVVPPALLTDDSSLEPVAARSPVPRDVGVVPWGTRRAAPVYVLVCLIFVSFLGAQVGFNTQLYSIAGDYGITAAGGALGVVAAVGMVARIIGIVVIRWAQPAVLLGGMALFQGVAALVLAMRPDPIGLYASAALLGMAVGNASVLSPVIVLHTFGAARYSRLLARLSFATTLGIAAGPVGVGVLRSALSSYDLILVGIGLVSFGVAGLCWLLARVTKPVASDVMASAET